MTVVIDQFAAWVAEARLPELPPDGGFARLRQEGTYVRHLRYAHAVTDTAPGHASLYTAVTPREHGIFGNEVVGVDAEKVSILRDANTRAITASGLSERVASSIARLRVATLADRLREHRPDATIVSLSIKDRGAIFGGGRSPDLSLWFDTTLDAFVTSTAFSQQLPGWASVLSITASVRARREHPWVLLDEPWTTSHAATPDTQPGEGNLVGFGTVFPHDFSQATSPAVAFRASPMADEALIDLGLAAVEHARHPNAPMLLAISLSANDYIGHVFGPDSWEAWDEIRRLDQNLARLMRGLDAQVGTDRWAIVLSADHGTITMPEASLMDAARPWCHGPNATHDDPYERPCGTVSRLIPEDIARELQDAAVQRLGEGRWVLGVADPYVFLSPAARALPEDHRAALHDALVARLRQHPEVLDVIDPKLQPEVCPTDDSVPALVCRSIPRAIDGDLYVLLRSGAFFDPGYTPGHGTSHGSPFLYDRTVPLLVRATRWVAAHRTVDDPLPFTTFSETAAALLELPWSAEHPSPIVRRR